MVLTNAEKQKRYRAKKSNALVTERNGNGNAPEPKPLPKVTRVTKMTHAEVDAHILAHPDEVHRCNGYPCRVDYHVNPQDYARRENPAKLNWGVWKDRDELLSDKQKKLGVQHNRVSIPGDWDYVKNI